MKIFTWASAVVAVFLGCFLGNWISHKIFPDDKYHERNHTVGEMFHAIAADEDKIADDWEQKLEGDGWSGWAGWNCGEQDSGLYRSLAMAMIREHRRAAIAIRSELPHEPEYHEDNWEDRERKQQEWRTWYQSFKAKPLRRAESEK